MLSNYWQCYLAGEKNYLVGVNGPIPNEQEELKRQIKELRLYEVSKIPGFIKESGAKQGFRPWSKEILENRLYKSLCVIYDKVIDASVGTEFMFVKYNEFDPPVHDIDGIITRPYLLAFRQVIIDGLPDPLPPSRKLVLNLLRTVKYGEAIELFKRREFTPEDIPVVEEKGGCYILTFSSRDSAELFRSMLRGYLRTFETFPVGSGMENLNITKVTMKKPVAPGFNHTARSTVSWRNSNYQHQPPRSSNNDNDAVSWRNSNYQHQTPRSSNNKNGGRQFSAPSSKRDMNTNWRLK